MDSSNSRKNKICKYCYELHKPIELKQSKGICPKLQTQVEQMRKKHSQKNNLKCSSCKGQGCFSRIVKELVYDESQTQRDYNKRVDNFYKQHFEGFIQNKIQQSEEELLIEDFNKMDQKDIFLDIWTRPNYPLRKIKKIALRKDIKQCKNCQGEGIISKVIPCGCVQGCNSCKYSQVTINPLHHEQLMRIRFESAVQKLYQKNEECTICQQPYSNDIRNIRLQCKHVFHYYCIGKWFSQKPNCPICRVGDLSFQQLVSKEEWKKQRYQKEETRKAAFKKRGNRVRDIQER